MMAPRNLSSRYNLEDVYALQYRPGHYYTITQNNHQVIPKCLLLKVQVFTATMLCSAVQKEQLQQVKIKALRSFETADTTSPMTQHHIPEDLNF
jgi:hypothetical protein